MNNIINYYYGLNIIDVYNLEDKYYFNYNNYNYFLILFNRDPKDIKSIIDLCIELKNRNVLTNEIIINKFNTFLTPINNNYYVLIKENSKDNLITMNDILYIQNNTVNMNASKNLYRIDSIKLWESKIDYYESKIKEIQNKYKYVDMSFDYYIGLAENAVIYLINNPVKVNNIVLSHRRIDLNKGAFDYYNPINYIIDNRTRDFAEYIKNLFFNGEFNFDNFINFLNYMNFNRDEYILFMARLLFPTYYFDLLDKIINNNENDLILENIINKADNYIDFLKNTFNYIFINKRINIPFITWIIKKI